MSYPTVTTPAAPTTTSTNGFAIASLVTSILGIGLLGVFFGISLLGVVFGHVALKKTAVTGESGRGIALAGLVVGYLGLVVGLFAFLLVPAIGMSGS